jgi:hypothetical protein
MQPLLAPLWALKSECCGAGGDGGGRGAALSSGDGLNRENDRAAKGACTANSDWGIAGRAAHKRTRVPERFKEDSGAGARCDDTFECRTDGPALFRHGRWFSHHRILDLWSQLPQRLARGIRVPAKTGPVKNG